MSRVLSAASSARLVPVDAETSAELPALADALTAEIAIRLEGAEAERLTAAVGLSSAAAALLLPMRTPDRNFVLVLAGDAVRELTVEEVEAAGALVAGGAASSSSAS